MTEFVRAEPRDDPLDRIEVELGDSKQAGTFYPQLKYMRWDNEVNLSARLTTDLTGGLWQDTAGTTEWTGRDLKCRWYEVGAKEGGYEFEIVLPSIPASNVFTFTVQTKGLNFYKQGPLDEEAERPPNWVTVSATEARDSHGVVVGRRPENVVGSYAVYHSTKQGDYAGLGGMNYRAGKAFHLYRPQVTDDGGRQVWADLELDEEAGTLALTIDRAWLLAARYPVVIDPTFGYDSIGGTETSYGPDIVNAHGPYSPASNGDATSVSFYLRHTGDSYPVTLGIYAQSGSDPGALLKDTAGATVTGTGWETQNLDSSLTVSSGSSYYLGMCNDTYVYRYNYDSTGGINYYYEAYSYVGGTLDDPYPGTTKLEGWQLSVYATYTAAAGGNPWYYYAQQ